MPEQPSEEQLAAIRSGTVDAIIIDGADGPQVYALEGTDAFYRVLIEQMPEGAAAVTRDGIILYANSTFGELLGGEAVGSTLFELAHGAAPDRVAELLAATEGDERSLDIDLPGLGGETVFIGLSARRVGDGTLCVVAIDLTQRERDEAALRRAEERFRSAFANAPIGMALLDADGNAERVNTALCAILGREAEDLLGTALPWLKRGPDTRALLARLADGGPGQITLENEGRHGSGRSIWAEVHLSAVHDDDRQVRHFIAQVQDVSERREHDARLRHVANHDHLTGLLNRRGFEQAMREHLAVAARYGASGALLLLDVDHFKYINDSRGHQVGDLVLVRLAEALRARMRESDVLARLGGDEFAVLLQRVDAHAATLVAEQVVQAARDLQISELVGLRRLTVSAGLAMVDEADRLAGEFMGLADLAMYDAKEAGRDRVVVYDPGEGSETAHRMTWLRRIKEALESDRLQLHQQPIVDLATGEVSARELLVRMPSAEGGVVDAASWFAVAERYDLATVIDEWVFDRAVELLEADPGGALGINVNVSATSIGRAGLLEHISAGIRSSRVDPARLTFEITETAAIGKIAAAVRFAESLHDLGCRLALDDFGAGFGSFYYLKHLPFDDVKIDGEFVRNSVNDERDQSIIRAMVDVSGSTGRRTVAESIEDAATLELMRAYGVDLAQGYHLGRPGPL